MKAVKVQGVVGHDRRLVIEVPDELGVGPVEVIVLRTEPTSGPTASITLADHLDFVTTLPVRRSRAQIDADIEAERSSWA